MFKNKIKVKKEKKNMDQKRKEKKRRGEKTLFQYYVKRGTRPPLVFFVNFNLYLPLPS